MKQKKLENIIIGTALTIAASTLLPMMKSSIRPLAANGMKGTLGLVERAQSLYQRAKEEVEDIVAEAQFARMKKQLDHDIAKSGATEEHTNFGK